MKNRLLCASALLAALAVLGGGWLRAQEAAAPAPPESADAQAVLQRRVESYLRYVLAWGPETQVRVGTLRPSALPGLYSVLVEVTQEKNKVQEVLLVSADGRYLVRGDVLDTTEDPFAEARELVRTDDQPSKGPTAAPVTIVEYGDFQCPTCGQMYPILKKLMAERHDVRLVFKDLPLVQKHDWALRAAVAGQCAYQQSNQAFWKLHDWFFENQKQLSAVNLDARLDAFAATAGLKPALFRQCRQQKQPLARVEDSLKEAATLRLANTPTLLINGRALIGAQPRQELDRVIDFEAVLSKQGSQQP